MTVRWTETALDHLAEVPASVGEAILRKVRLASRYPGMFPERQRGSYRGYRWFPVDGWLVFYREAGRSIIVLGIAHGARRGA